MKTRFAITSVLLIILMMASTRSVAAVSGTFYIQDNATGGNCTSIGSWNLDTKECTLTTDITGSIEVLSDNITLNGNGYTLISPSAPTQYGGTGVYLANRKGIVIKNLILIRFQEGIMLSSGSGNELKNNTITNGLDGIHLYGSSGNIITGNTMENNSNSARGEGTAILIQASSNNNTVEHNTLSNNYFGVYIASSSSNNIVRFNVINTSDYIGIVVDAYCTNNEVSKNTVAMGAVGIVISYANETKIYNNNFVDNAQRPWNNQWQNYGNVFSLPAPIGGNYWSDFDSPEEGCNDTNSDGFCDSPYTFLNNQDNLPWTHLINWENQPPISEASGPYAGFVGDTITLDASASSDPDGDTLTYDWDLDNDGQYDDATGVITTTVFNQAGEYTVGLRVMDALGLNNTDTATVTITSPVSNPTIVVRPWQDFVHGWDWPDGAWVTLTLDNPNTPESPDYTETNQASYSAPWSPQNTLVAFVNGALDIKAGDIVTLTDGVTIKTHITTTLTVDQFDVNADTVSGTAEPGSEVSNLNVCDDTGCSERTVIADPSGHWITDFSIPGNADHPETIDIRPNTEGIAIQNDEDGDATHIGWRVPNPVFSVVPNDPNSGPGNIILGQDFEVGTTVNLCIDNPPFGSECEYADSLTVPYEPNGFAGYQFQFSVNPSVFQIVSGQRVQLDNGLHTEQHIVTNMRLLWVDWDTDQVGGTADPGSEVEVPAAGDDQYVIRRVTADNDGNWTADFAHPGNAPDEQEIIDLRLGHVFFIPEQWDENGNSTKFWWQPSNPYFFVDFAGDHVYAFQWPVGATVTVTIDDPATTYVDFMKTQPVRTDNPWSSETWIDFQSPIPFKSGLLITMTDGDTVKTHTVTDLTITEANSETDTVSGTATPGALVRVWIHDPVCCIMRHVIADADGRWTADYSIPGDEDFETETFDLQPGNSGQASQPDEDTDATNKPWQTPNPSITVYPDDEVIEGSEWPLDAILTVQIGNPDQPDYATTTTLNPADQDHALPWFKLDLAGTFNLQPGQMVTVFDAKTTKQVIAVNRNITSIDPLTDIITGVADQTVAAVVLWVCDDNGCAVRRKDVNLDGSWSVNFAEPGELDWENVIFDIKPDTNGGIYQSENDNDGTTYQQWYSVNQPPVAEAGPDQTVYVLDPVTLDAGASSDPDGDTLTYAWDLNDDGQYDDANGMTVTTTFAASGDHTVGLLVTDESGLSSSDTVTITVQSWTLKGFYQPVDMNGVYNIVKGGSTVPLKFEIFAGLTELTDVAKVKSLTYAQTSCDASAITDEIETTATGGTSLRYADGQFIYNWKTPRMAGTCYRVTMTTIDGSSLVAYFKLK